VVGIDDQSSPGALAAGEGVEVIAITSGTAKLNASNLYYAGDDHMVVAMLGRG
jgi:hypothetical protein